MKPLKALGIGLFLALLATAFIDTVGIHYGVPFMWRVLVCGIVGGIIGWVMKKLTKWEGD